ncbi:PAS domain-containing sensor histidine kinase [Pedobacter mucosus]|uniref:PAS domain-containing sensor histidine kinase n=1 Tax=Pedobacter mucosus TaxID=2895286 RepID=UPI001EE4BEAA|nr:PAS domain-containing sensor histidine kinase [Pedobacter mucosus]UKT62414.1 PAS domain-containing sensor histidine kinase [Pedobacter mucosus]
MQVNIEDEAAIFNTIIQESSTPIALYVGEKMVIKIANQAMLNAWGKDNSVIGKELAIALPEIENQPFMNILSDVFTRGITYHTSDDQVNLVHNGILESYFFDFTYKPLKDNQGKVWGILNNATNVTSLVKARMVVKDSETTFRKIIQDAPVAIGILRGKKFIIEQANEDLLRLWGKNKSIIGEDLINGLPEIKDQPFIQLLTNVYETGVAYHGYETLAKLEHNNVLEDCYFNFVYDPIKNHRNEVTGVMVIANDVSSQVNARIEVAKSEDRFKKLLLEAPIAMAYYETENIIISLANDEMLKLWGKGNSVFGKPMIDAIPELESQPFIDILKNVFITGIPYHADQQPADLVVDGTLKTFYFNFTYKPIFNSKGNVYAILHAAMDVTNQVNLQQQKDEFLGVASHELKTPVTSIKAYAQVLERIIRSEGDERKANLVMKMDLQLNRLTDLIGDLLDVTKIQSGKMTFNATQFDFDLAVADLVEDIQLTTSKHKIQLDLASNAHVLADKDRIGQVVINFISNAINYSVDGDNIDVRSYVEKNEVILSVKDYGIGIDTEVQDLIFNQFYRVGGSLQHTYPGLGLGLYISSEIIKTENGRIWVESVKGKGSTFFFALKL